MTAAVSGVMARTAERAGAMAFAVPLVLAVLAFAATDGVLAMAGLEDRAEVARSLLWIAALAVALLGVASRRGADLAGASAGVALDA